jgi:ribulose-phosphate 3-epimerase
MVRVAPSILSADFARLGEQVRETERGGADRIHVDVMDGHFVPNLSMGPAVVKSLRRVTQLPLEVHLMVEDPARFISPFLDAGADSLIVHREVVNDPRPLARDVRGRGKRFGVAVRPDTPVGELAALLPEIDLALCMTVYPGYAGQKFLPESPGRIRELDGMIKAGNFRCELEVDGGIDEQTAPLAVAAGANVLVAATAVFGHPGGPAAAVSRLVAMFGET